MTQNLSPEATLLSRKQRRAGKILVPVLHDQPGEPLIRAAKALSRGREVLVQGYVYIPPEESLSEAAGSARDLREQLQAEAEAGKIDLLPKISVSHHVPHEIAATVAEEDINLVVLPCPRPGWDSGDQVRATLMHATFDAALLKGPQPEPGASILVILRPGPDSELGLRLALRLARYAESSITTLRPTDLASNQSAMQASEALEQVLQYLPEIDDTLLISDDPFQAILEQSVQYDVVIVGANCHQQDGEILFDELSEELIQTFQSSLIVTCTPSKTGPAPPRVVGGVEAISILVDKWFAENTFHSDEFSELRQLQTLKERQGLSISLALPALNEEETVANVILTLRSSLMDEVQLLDEIILVDSNSTDRTRQIAERLDIPVHIHQQVLPQYGSREGKGEALWKSLYLTKGDLIFWVDTDIVNIHPRFVYGLIGPLLRRPELMFIKGFYLRPIKVGDRVQAGGGGRVTELTARPMLNLFYPALSGFIQPLSGEYGGRREALEQIPFSSGYGVETGMLIDLLEEFGIDAMGQVDLLRRVHHNQPLGELSKMSFAIIQTLIRKIDERQQLSLLKDVNRTMKIVSREKERFFLDVVEIAELQRPAMISIPEYGEKFNIDH
jgi:glucosyl-3-phosphoglycerate synthase